MFEIHAGGEAHYRPAGEISLQRAPEASFVGDAGHATRGLGALIAIAAEVEASGPSLPHALHLQTKRRRLYLRIQHPADEITLIRPQMQQAFVLLAGDRVLRFRQIKCDGAVFHNNCGAGSKKEVGK